jgi:hypothetical protein
VPVGAAIGSVVAGVGSSAIGAISASKAAKKQAAAAQRGQDLTMEMYEQSREDLKPYNETGQAALMSLADMYGLPSDKNPEGGQAFNDASLEAFRRSPDYQAALQEGVRARDLSAASRGNLLSGGQEKRLLEFGSNLASTRFGSYLDRLRSLAGMGESAAARSASGAMQTGSNLSNLALGEGEAKASGIVGVGNAITAGINGVASNLGDYFAATGGSSYGSGPHPLYG